MIPLKRAVDAQLQNVKMSLNSWNETIADHLESVFKHLSLFKKNIDSIKLCEPGKQHFLEKQNKFFCSLKDIVSANFSCLFQSLLLASSVVLASDDGDKACFADSARKCIENNLKQTSTAFSGLKTLVEIQEESLEAILQRNKLVQEDNPASFEIIELLHFEISRIKRVFARVEGEIMTQQQAITETIQFERLFLLSTTRLPPDGDVGTSSKQTCMSRYKSV